MKLFQAHSQYVLEIKIRSKIIQGRKTFGLEEHIDMLLSGISYEGLYNGNIILLGEIDNCMYNKDNDIILFNMSSKHDKMSVKLITKFYKQLLTKQELE